MEFWTIRPAGPENLVRVVRQPSPGSAETFVVEAELAEQAVLAFWAEDAEEKLGYRPTWALVAALAV